MYFSACEAASISFVRNLFRPKPSGLPESAESHTLHGRTTKRDRTPAWTDPPMDTAAQLDLTHSQILIVDMQERLMPHVDDGAGVTRQVARLVRAATAMRLPITISEQYPEGLGRTVAELAQLVTGADRIMKMTFSVWRDDTARERLTSHLRPQIVVAGVETHVCVQQTVLDLLGMQMQPFVLADAVGSRHRTDRDVALQRMSAAGAVVTTVESAIYELLEEAGTPLFKRVLEIVKA